MRSRYVLPPGSPSFLSSRFLSLALSLGAGAFPSRVVCWAENSVSARMCPRIRSAIALRFAFGTLAPRDAVEVKNCRGLDAHLG